MLQVINEDVKSEIIYKKINIVNKKLWKYITKRHIVYHNFFIPKIIVVFRTDLHKMKIKHRITGEYATKRCFFFPI